MHSVPPSQPSPPLPESIPTIWAEPLPPRRMSLTASRFRASAWQVDRGDSGPSIFLSLLVHSGREGGGGAAAAGHQGLLSGDIQVVKCGSSSNADALRAAPTRTIGAGGVEAGMGEAHQAGYQDADEGRRRQAGTTNGNCEGKQGVDIVSHRGTSA